MGYVQEARENHVKKKVEEALSSKMMVVISIPKNYVHTEAIRLGLFTEFVFMEQYANIHSSKTPALRSKMKQKALKQCDRYTEKYAECAMGKTISVVWNCRKQAKELNECLHQYTNDSVLEQMKKEYMLQQEEKGSLSL